MRISPRLWSLEKGEINMKCPNCNAVKTKLKVESTHNEYLTFTHRYVCCGKCGTSFQTKETILWDTVIARCFEEEEKNPSGDYS